MRFYFSSTSYSIKLPLGRPTGPYIRVVHPTVEPQRWPGCTVLQRNYYSKISNISDLSKIRTTVCEQIKLRYNIYVSVRIFIFISTSLHHRNIIYLNTQGLHMNRVVLMEFGSGAGGCGLSAAALTFGLWWSILCPASEH